MDILSSNDNGILVLNYHRIAGEFDQNYPLSEKRFTVSVEEFTKQMNLISELNIPVVPITELSNPDFSHNFAISLTFDDGNVSDHSVVFPIVKSFNYPAAFFPVIHSIEARGKITWHQLEELAANHFTIGSHGISHAALISLSSEQKRHEMCVSKALLEDKLKIPVEYFAAPFGFIDQEIIRISKDAGYISVLSTRLKMNRPSLKPDRIYRWNMKRNTSVDTLRYLLVNKGKLSITDTLFTAFLEAGKQMVGHRFTQRVGGFLYH